MTRRTYSVLHDLASYLLSDFSFVNVLCSNFPDLRIFISSLSRGLWRFPHSKLDQDDYTLRRLMVSLTVFSVPHFNGRNSTLPPASRHLVTRSISTLNFFVTPRSLGFFSPPPLKPHVPGLPLLSMSRRLIRHTNSTVCVCVCILPGSNRLSFLECMGVRTSGSFWSSPSPPLHIRSFRLETIPDFLSKWLSSDEYRRTPHAELDLN